MTPFYFLILKAKDRNKFIASAFLKPTFNGVFTDLESFILFCCLLYCVEDVVCVLVLEFLSTSSEEKNFFLALVFQNVSLIMITSKKF